MLQTEAYFFGWGHPSSSSAETINDGQFHTVELVTFDQMVNLSIDGGSPMTMDNFGKHYTLNSEAPLYVGGEELALGRLQLSFSRILHWAMMTASPGGASFALWPERARRPDPGTACEGKCREVGVVPANGQVAGGLPSPAWSPGCSSPRRIRDRPRRGSGAFLAISPTMDTFLLIFGPEGAPFPVLGPQRPELLQETAQSPSISWELPLGHTGVAGQVILSTTHKRFWFGWSQALGTVGGGLLIPGPWF